MCLLNGEVGGSITAPTHFDSWEEEVDGEWVIKKYPIKQIIRDSVHQLAGEPYHNIVINDLDDKALELLEYRYDEPTFLLRPKDSPDYIQGTLNPNTQMYLYGGQETVSIGAKDVKGNYKYKFDTFVVGSNNKFAHSASLAVAETPGKAYNPLYLYGGPGLGKTHLMHSIGHFIMEENPNTKVLYVTSEEFTNEVIESIRSGNAQAMTKLREKYRTVDVLMIDDVQFIIGKESTQEEFFHTFNELHQAGKQIVLSSDRPPKEMETLDERFRSRFEWGLIADIQPPSYETRMAILRKNVENSHFNVDDQVLEYIATNIKSNIRELEGAIKKITAYSRLNNVEITTENAKEALTDMIYPEKNDVVTPDRIMSVVCDHYGVKPAAIMSQKKDSEIVIPRQVIMYLCKNYTDITYDAIAKMLGKKDHSTIMHGANKIKNDLSDNDELKGNIEVILKKLNVKA